MEQGTGNSRADLLAEIEAAANRFGTTTADLEASGNSALLREIENAAVARQQKFSGAPNTSSLFAEISQGPGKSGLRPVSGPGRTMGNAELLSQIQATGVKRAAVPQVEGVASTVLQAMSTHTSNAGVQAAGCSALWSMAYQNPYNRAAMGRQGAHRPIESILSRTSIRTALLASSSFLTNAQACAPWFVDAVGAIITALQTHPRHAGVQAAGCSALASFACDEVRTPAKPPDFIAKRSFVQL